MQEQNPPLLSKPQKYKAWLSHALKAALSIGIVAYLAHVTDIGKIAGAMGKISPSAFLIAFALNIVGVVYLQALANRYSLVPKGAMTTGQLSKDNLAIMFYTLFMPAGLTFVIRWNKYRARGYGGMNSAAQVLFHKVLQIWASFLFLLIGILMYGDKLPVNAALLNAIVIAAFAGFSLWMLAFYSKTLAALIDRLGASNELAQGQGISGKLRNRLGKIVHKIGTACTAFAEQSLSERLAVLFFGLGQHLCVVAGGWIIVTQFAPELPFMVMGIVRSVVVLLMLIPVSVAGLGFRELGFFGLLPHFGVSAEAALASSFLLFGVQLAMGACGAVVEFLDWINGKNRVDHAE